MQIECNILNCHNFYRVQILPLRKVDFFSRFLEVFDIFGHF